MHLTRGKAHPVLVHPFPRSRGARLTARHHRAPLPSRGRVPAASPRLPGTADPPGGSSSPVAAAVPRPPGAVRTASVLGGAPGPALWRGGTEPVLPGHHGGRGRQRAGHPAERSRSGSSPPRGGGCEDIRQGPPAPRHPGPIRKRAGSRPGRGRTRRALPHHPRPSDPGLAPPRSRPARDRFGGRGGSACRRAAPAQGDASPVVSACPVRPRLLGRAGRGRTPGAGSAAPRPGASARDGGRPPPAAYRCPSRRPLDSPREVDQGPTEATDGAWGGVGAGLQGLPPPVPQAPASSTPTATGPVFRAGRVERGDRSATKCRDRRSTRFVPAPGPPETGFRDKRPRTWLEAGAWT